MAELITRIVRYLYSGSARFITSAEMAVFLFDLQSGESLKGPQEKIRRALRINRTDLAAKGIEIEVCKMGYRIKRKPNHKGASASA